MRIECVTLVGLIGSVISNEPIVDTNYGPIQGKIVTDLQGRTIEEFLGIPYAKPPVGERRWKRPERHDAWEEVYDATYYRDHCHQFLTPVYPLVGIGGNHSEDCLHLNIYVPGSVESAKEKKLPVMFFIHGGGYTFGTAEMYPGTGLAAQGDVIVVNTNYRLGVLGFFTTGTDDAKGNQLLWDIRAALEWTHENIAEFGGDVERVTIFGHSAGGDAVSHLMLSPETQHLFHRGIAISGGNARNGTLRGSAERAAENARAFAATFCCENEDASEMLGCLREVDGDTIYARGNTIGWSWVIDGEFIPVEPAVAWQTGAAKDHGYMGGCTHHDSAGFVLGNPIAFPGLNYTLAASRTLESTRNSVRARVRSYFEDPEPIVDMLYERYPGLDSEDIAIRTEMLSLHDTDSSFGSPTHHQAELHSENEGKTGGTYWYIYRYHNTFLVGYPDWVDGSHMDDIYSVLGEPFMALYRLLWLRADFNDVDKRVKEDTMSYYVNFAYTGNPNEGPREVATEWPEYSTEERKHMILSDDMRAPSIDEDLLENYDWWIHELPRLAAEENAVTGWSVDFDKPTDFPMKTRSLTDIAHILPSLLLELAKHQ